MDEVNGSIAPLNIPRGGVTRTSMASLNIDKKSEEEWEEKKEALGAQKRSKIKEDWLQTKNVQSTGKNLKDR